MFDTPEQMQERIDEYFEFLDKPKEEKPKDHLDTTPTITGLVFYMGFADRKSFYEYEQKEAFTHTIKRARTMVENWYEQCIIGNNATGPIFALKNLGWRDKQELEHSGEIDNPSFNLVVKPKNGN